MQPYAGSPRLRGDLGVYSAPDGLRNSLSYGVVSALATDARLNPPADRIAWITGINPLANSLAIRTCVARPVEPARGGKSV
jgi:hypothetical protein